MQSEVEKAVNEHGKTSGQRTGRHAAPELVLRFPPRKTLAKKNQNKGQTQHAPHNASVGERLQVVVVCLLKPVKAVPRIIAGIDYAEGTQPGSDYRISLHHLDRHVPQRLA